MSKSSESNGFTLVELLVAMAITGIVAGAIFTAFQSQQKSYFVQDQVAEMQQNLRAAMDIMVRDIRMAGYSQGVPGFGITDISPRDTDDNVDVTITGNGSFEFTADFDDNGTLSGGETLLYQLYDNDALRRTPGGSAVAENIEALGFAYAFDADGDGNLDTYSAGGNQAVIWAVDSDGDNYLDRNLDTDVDGNITAADGPGLGGNGLIGGTAITDVVAPQDIRAVRIWMLARTKHGDNSFLNTKTYTVGIKVITPNNNLRMRLLTTTVRCRNMGL